MTWLSTIRTTMSVAVSSTATGRSTSYGAIRAATTAMDKPIITTVQQLAAAVLAIEAVQQGGLEVTSLQEHTAALDLFGVEAGA